MASLFLFVIVCWARALAYDQDISELYMYYQGARMLISTVTSATSPSCYILSTDIIAKGLQPLNPMTHKYFTMALAAHLDLHLDSPEMMGLSVHFIPYTPTEIELIIVFPPHNSLISDIWNFVISKPLQGLYECKTTPIIKRMFNSTQNTHSVLAIASDL